MKKIAFICTGNSARSQMAEGYGKYLAKLYGKNLEIYSAGSNPSGYVHPLAIKVMAEDGIDISNQYSKHIDEIQINEVDYVITLCGDAAENCPLVPGAKTEHWGLPDPAKVIGPTEDVKLNAFRKVRDQIKEKIEKLIKEI